MKTIVLGGGIAGLTLARELLRNGIEVLVIDKGRNVGGRLATRETGHDSDVSLIDFGAQYYTVRDHDFGQFHEELLTQGITRYWSDGFMHMDGRKISDGTPRFVGLQGMRGITHYLAKDLNILQGRRVDMLRFEHQQWTLVLDDASTVHAQRVVSTIPVPQWLELALRSTLSHTQSELESLQQVAYHPCLTAMISLSGESAIPAPGGLFGDGNPVAWMADSRQKRLSETLTSVVIQAAPEFSAQLYTAEKEFVLERLIDAARPWLGSEVISAHLHRWKFSQPYRFVGKPCLMPEAYRNQLVLTGDAFLEARVEGAWLAGFKTAKLM